jgi:pimeloyl-ACP methyl ester carboxylesterase
MSTRARFLELSDARIRFRCAGRGPVVVFVHGWALDLDMWEPQLAQLSDQLRVVAFDRRGFGSSTGTPSIERDADDLRDLLDAIGAPPVAIVGMSQGARVAALCAVKFPVRVVALVLDGPPHESAAGEPVSAGDVPIARYRELVRRGEMDLVRQDWLRHPLMRLHTRDERPHALLREMVARYPGNDLRAKDARPAPLAQLVRTLDLPVLVLNGAEDHAARRAAGAALARSMRNARHAIVPSAGHLPNLDNPAAYHAQLASFLGPIVAASDAAERPLEPLEKTK